MHIYSLCSLSLGLSSSLRLFIHAGPFIYDGGVSTTEFRSSSIVDYQSSCMYACYVSYLATPLGCHACDAFNIYVYCYISMLVRPLDFICVQCE